MLLMVASVLPDIPGAKRFSRYVSYPDKDALIAAETNDVTSVCDCSLNGTNYLVVVMKPCRFIASGPAVLVYGQDGRLFDKTGDEGDDSRFQQTWHWRKSLSSQTEKWLRNPVMLQAQLLNGPGMCLERLSHGLWMRRDCQSDSLRTRREMCSAGLMKP